MKHLSVRAQVDPECAPMYFNLLAHSEVVDEVRVVDWNMADPEVTTFIYEIDGDAEAFAESAAETDGIESVEVAGVDGDPSHALVTAREGAIPMFASVAEAMAQAGLVVRKPVVYRDGVVSCHVVGEPASLQAAMDAAPGDVTVHIDEIGSYPCDRVDSASLLSERQREAVTEALNLGYYDSPRRATHEDIATELGCAPSTVSEHLQKAERKFVRSSMDVKEAVEQPEPELPTH